MGERDDREDRWDQPARIRLLERDIDDLISLRRQDLDAVGALKAELARVKGILVGVLISTTTAALIFAATRAVTG